MNCPPISIFDFGLNHFFVSGFFVQSSFFVGLELINRYSLDFQHSSNIEGSNFHHQPLKVKHHSFHMVFQFQSLFHSSIQYILFGYSYLLPC